MRERQEQNMKPGTVALAVSAKQLGESLGVSLRHVRRMDAGGKLPRPIRLGRATRWPVAEIENWLAAGAPRRTDWEQAKRTS